MKRRASVHQTLLVTLLAPGAFFTQAAAQPGACGSEVKTAEINGATLHYFECGEGESLVFVHGAIGNLHTFGEQLETFSKEFRVIAYSRRFHPPNDLPQDGDTHTEQIHVDDLAALVRDFGASPAHLVGNSGGAYFALALALQHPELVRTLVLGEPPILPLLLRTSVGRSLNESWNRRVLGASRSAFESGELEEGMRRFLDGISGEPGTFDQLLEPARTNLMQYAPVMRLEILAEQSASLTLACDALGQLEQPILLLTGEQSPAMFMLVNAELERCLEAETHVMVPEAGHGMHAENAAFYNEAVLAFLRDQ
jgi:non-heme chloroperoxidase